MKNKYRICKDKFCGYRLEIKYWWWPFWENVDSSYGTNTFSTVEEAEEFHKIIINPAVKLL